jgi:hypothetical protein
MKKTTALISAAIAVSLSPVFSAAGENIPNKTDSDYFTIARTIVNVRELEPSGTEIKLPEPERLNPERLNKAAPLAVGAIINTGATAWNIIKDGQASSNLPHFYASALPNMVFSWSTVSGWKGPKEIVYEIKAENLFGMTVVDFEYVVSFFYGGSIHGHPGFKDGGNYITNFTVKPTKFKILWGFKFVMDLTISDPMNVGSPENPLAYLQADVNWTLSSPLKNEKGFETYGVYGNGNFRDLTAKEKALTKGIQAPVEPSETPSVSWD